jgi:hypothetical protein
MPDRLFHPSLMFVGKAWSSPKTGVIETCFTLIGSWPHLLTLDKAEKACQGQTLQLILKKIL